MEIDGEKAEFSFEFTEWEAGRKKGRGQDAQAGRGGGRGGRWGKEGGPGSFPGKGGFWVWQGERGDV